MDPIVDALPCGFLSFTDDGNVVAANHALLEILGYDRSALLGRHVERLMPAGTRIFYQTHLFPLLKLHGHVEEIYLALRTRTGHDVPMLVNAARTLRDGIAVNDAVLLSMRQRDEYEDRILDARRIAEEATRAKDEFLAVVSHELRTPLTAVLGWARLLKSGRLDAETTRRAVDAIERNAEAQATLIGDILDFGRIISGKLRLDVAPLQPVLVVDAALDVVKPGADAKGIRIATALDAAAGPVSGDASRLQQVLWNLLSNAVKFTPRGGRVHVTLSRSNSSVQIVVSDTGEGIDPGFLPYVFERFRQADHSPGREHGGLGLGLAITRHIVELHGGTIRAQSAGPGRGASFTVCLPVLLAHDAPLAEPAPSRRVAQPERASPRLAGLHVLVVEDERDARELLATIVADAGGRATVVASAADALQAIGRERPDLVLSDIEMPGEDGYALMQAIRALPPREGGGLPAIALTAQAKSADRLKALSAGFQVHLSKPVDPDELVVAIANLARTAVLAR